MKTVDITILSWDRIDDTVAAIDSALQQKGIDGQVIVVDQGSTKENVHRLRSFCRDKANLSVVYNNTNLGVPGGRNLASNQNDGEYIVALDNDAEFIDEFQLQKAVEIMDANPELGILAFRILRFGTDEDDLSSWAYWQKPAEFADKTFYTTRFVGAGHMIRRSAFERVQGYDDALFFLHEEVDLAKRFINTGYKIMYTPDVVIGHKVSAEHRVNWTDMRWRLDIRNNFYLHIKLRTKFLTLCYIMFLMLIRGIKSRIIWNTLVGLWQGVGMIPLALKKRQQDIGTEQTDQAREYNQRYSNMKNMSTMQRILFRLRSLSKVPQNVGSK